MEHFEFIEKLFNEEQDDFSIEELKRISQASKTEFNHLIEDLCNQKILEKNNERYSISDKGRIDFANNYSKDVMGRFLAFSFLILFLFYLLARFIN